MDNLLKDIVKQTNKDPKDVDPENVLRTMEAEAGGTLLQPIKIASGIETTDNLQQINIDKEVLKLMKTLK